ncbi:uncharacterized protein LOC134813705 [Bolinopsis microptera]|uniref:uncharacterized protein LOC134813705 n=1 Tax=Bolinopsis microptera TaxID=2820187 RepID=UPI00307AB3B7
MVMLILLTIGFVYETFPGIAAECQAQTVDCNGVLECDDYSDEIGCSTKGVYSRMGLSDETRFLVRTPDGDHTFCFYTFGKLDLFTSDFGSNSSPVDIKSKGHYCLVNENEKKTIEGYLYDTSTKSFIIAGEGSIKANHTVGVWGIQADSIIKNIMVYRKALSPPEMLGYITNCGNDGYSAAIDVFLDHHLVVVLNIKYRQSVSKNPDDSSEQSKNPDDSSEQRMNKIRSIVKRDDDNDDDNDDDESPPGSGWIKSETNDYDIDLSSSDEDVFPAFKYTALTDMCQEGFTPTGSVDLATTHICESGLTISNHCCEGDICERCNEADPDKTVECEYVKSQIVALAKKGNEKSCSSRAEIVNAYNNILGTDAIRSANTFTDCQKSSCVSKAYLQNLMSGAANIWASERTMEYSAWTSPIASEEGSRAVVLSKDGDWSLESDLPEDSSVLCNVGDSTKALKFQTPSDFSQIRVSKTEAFRKLTICWAASGSGVLLHYTGVSSITGKDIYIATEIINARTYLTVYIAGYPEYFDVDSSIGNYICLRWEKSTGNIDLAINGEWVVGKNTYASSRRINLPKSGRLVIGAEINTAVDPMLVDANSGRWTGLIKNLVIWDRFYNPLMLIKTSEKAMCSERAKSSDGWLTFEMVIAGSTNHEMYSNFEYSSSNCGQFNEENENRYEKRDEKRDDDRDEPSSISIDYSTYSSDPTFVFKWVKSTEEGVTISIAEDMNYIVTKLSDKGNIKLDPLSALCISGLKGTSSYAFVVAAHSTGLTTLQVGQKIITVPYGTPGSGQVENVYPVGDKICITNVLAPSDYAPLDGFIESIHYMVDSKDPLPCPSEEQITTDQGVLVWPPVKESGDVTTACQYGKVSDYTKVGLATRTCSQSGWSGVGDVTACAVKYTIPTKEAEEYFEDTEITDENVEEFADTINQVVQETDTVTQQQMVTAADAMEKLTNTTNVTISSTAMTTVVEIANIININGESETEEIKEDEAKTATRIVESVEKLAGKVDVPVNETFVAKTETVSVAVHKPPNPDNSSGKEHLGDITAFFIEFYDGTDIDVSTKKVDPLKKSENDRITIRREQINPGENVWFTSYREGSSLFNSDTTIEVDGEIIGAGIGEKKKKFEDGKGIIMTFYTYYDLEKENALCQFWDTSGKVGKWSSEGMKFINKTDLYITCQSNHLTNFAILINPSNKIFAGGQRLALQIITILGTVLSMIGLVATIVGLSVFKQIRSVLTNKVHIGLSSSLLIAYFFLLVGADLVGSEGVCYFFSIVTHFWFLCAFCWMMCEALNLYLRLVVVFETYSKMFLKYSIFSLVTPLVIVLVTVIVEFAGENGAYIISNKASGSRLYCWLDYKARMVAFMLPLILILCTNLIVFIIVMRVLFSNKQGHASPTNKSHWIARLRSAVVVSTLIGLSWIMGIFALGEASFVINVIFTLVNSLQGVMIFYLYCFSKKEVFTKWKSTIQSSLDKSSIADYKNGTNTFNSGPPRTNNGINSTSTTNLKTGPSVLRNIDMDSPGENEEKLTNSPEVEQTISNVEPEEEVHPQSSPEITPPSPASLKKIYLVCTTEIQPPSLTEDENMDQIPIPEIPPPSSANEEKIDHICTPEIPPPTPTEDDKIHLSRRSPSDIPPPTLSENNTIDDRKLTEVQSPTPTEDDHIDQSISSDIPSPEREEQEIATDMLHFLM